VLLGWAGFAYNLGYEKCQYYMIVLFHGAGLYAVIFIALFVVKWVRFSQRFGKVCDVIIFINTM
jgi:hypothetical protein